MTLAGCDDGIGNLLVQHAQLGIGAGGGHLHIRNRNDVLRIVVHMRCRNLIIVNSPLRLNAVVGICRNLQFSNQVTFDPEF